MIDWLGHILSWVASVPVPHAPVSVCLCSWWVVFPFFLCGVCVGGLGCGWLWLAVAVLFLCLVPDGGFPDMEGFSVIVVLLCLAYAFFGQSFRMPTVHKNLTWSCGLMESRIEPTSGGFQFESGWSSGESDPDSPNPGRSLPSGPVRKQEQQ